MTDCPVCDGSGWVRAAVEMTEQLSRLRKLAEGALRTILPLRRTHGAGHTRRDRPADLAQRTSSARHRGNQRVGVLGAVALSPDERRASPVCLPSPPVPTVRFELTLDAV